MITENRCICGHYFEDDDYYIYEEGIIRCPNCETEYFINIKRRKILLTDEDKEIIKSGTFMQQSGLLMKHFEDETWIKEAHTYLKTILDR